MKTGTGQKTIKIVTREWETDKRGNRNERTENTKTKEQEMKNKQKQEHDKITIIQEREWNLLNYLSDTQKMKPQVVT